MRRNGSGSAASRSRVVTKHGIAGAAARARRAPDMAAGLRHRLSRQTARTAAPHRCCRRQRGDILGHAAVKHAVEPKRGRCRCRADPVRGRARGSAPRWCWRSAGRARRCEIRVGPPPDQRERVAAHHFGERRQRRARVVVVMLHDPDRAHPHDIDLARRERRLGAARARRGQQLDREPLIGIGADRMRRIERRVQHKAVILEQPQAIRFGQALIPFVMAVGRGDAHPHRLLVARDLQHDLAAGRAAGPDPPPERGKARDRLVAHRQDAVAGPQPVLRRGRARTDRRRRSRPRPRRRRGRARAAAAGWAGHRSAVVEDRRQQVDRHDHVDVAAQFAAVRVLHVQRADADQRAVWPPISAAPPQNGCAGAVKIAGRAGIPNSRRIPGGRRPSRRSRAAGRPRPHDAAVAGADPLAAAELDRRHR
jgi:hypothetical protein